MEKPVVLFEYENSFTKRGDIYVNNVRFTSFSWDRKQQVFICEVRGDGFTDTRIPGKKFIRDRHPSGLVKQIEKYIEKGKIDPSKIH